MAKSITILGIETSCDETAAAVVELKNNRFRVLSSAVASQVDLHKLTGGVVPEVAAREHVTTIMPTIKLALNRATIQMSKSKFQINSKAQNSKLNSLDAIAVTAGPGLLPALLVGVDTANALSLATGIPAIPVQHITGHIYANFVGKSEIRKPPPWAEKSKRYHNDLRSDKNVIDVRRIKFPLLALVVSGGHSEFILMKNYLQFKKLGQTLDDAAGECFDKCAKILGLPYPGGPQISKAALNGNPKAFNFPRPLLRSKSYGGQARFPDGNLNFSFAGLKTAVLYKVNDLVKIKNQKSKIKNTNKNSKLPKQTTADLAASVQAAIVETLVKKTERAIKKNKPKSFTLGGGVAANSELRNQLRNLLSDNFPKVKYYETKVEYATDNAVMIAAVGAMLARKNFTKKLGGKKLSKFVKANPQLEIKQ